MSRLDRSANWRVYLSVRTLTPLILGSALALGGACGGKDKKQETLPSGSSGSVSAGTPMTPQSDPANMDPASGIPMADPNDKPPERQAEAPGSAPDEAVEPELRPPGLDKSPEERKAAVAAHLQSAASAMQNNSDPDRAIREAKAALQVDETSIDAMVLLAHGNVVKGYYDLAEDVLLKAFNRGGKSNKKAFFLLGLVYEKTDRPEKAPIAYQNALTLDPNYKSALMNLGVSHLRQKRFKDAVQLFEKLTGPLKMDIASVWTNLGSAYRGLSVEFQLTNITTRNSLVIKANEAYKRAISLDKNYANAYYNMALLYLDADPYPQRDGSDMDKVARLKNAKTYFDEYRRLPGTDQKLVDATSSVAQKLLDKEELLRKKQAEREAKRRALEAKRKEREAKGNADDEFDSDEGFE